MPTNVPIPGGGARWNWVPGQPWAQESWVSYYWALAQEFGLECLHISRADMLASALTIGYVFLINRNDLDFSVGGEACVATFVTLGIVHSFRIPWLLVRRLRDREGPLPFGWGVLGIVFFVAFLACVVYVAALRYTTLPTIIIEARLPDGRNRRIEELEAETDALRAKLPDDKSLKVRLIEAAEEYDQFWQKYPKGPMCTQTNTMTPEQQRKTIEPCTNYFLKRETDYQQLMAPKIMALVQEFKAKGGNVLNIENCAAAGYCGIPLVVQLKAFSLQLDTRDTLKGSTCFP